MWNNRTYEKSALILCIVWGALTSLASEEVYLFEVGCKNCSDGSGFRITDNFGFVTEVQAREGKLNFKARYIEPQSIKFVSMEGLAVLEFHPCKFNDFDGALNVIGELVVEPSSKAPQRFDVKENSKSKKSRPNGSVTDPPPPPLPQPQPQQPKSPPFLALLAERAAVLNGTSECKYLAASDVSGRVFQLAPDKGRDLLFADLQAAILLQCGTPAEQEKVLNDLGKLLARFPEYWCELLDRPEQVYSLLAQRAAPAQPIEETKCSTELQQIQFLVCEEKVAAGLGCDVLIKPLAGDSMGNFFAAIHQLNTTGVCPLPRKFPPLPPCPDSSMNMCLSAVVRLANSCDSTKNLRPLNDARVLFAKSPPPLAEEAKVVFSAELQFLGENWQDAADLFAASLAKFNDPSIRSMLLCRQGQALLEAERFLEAEGKFDEAESISGAGKGDKLAARFNRIYTKLSYLKISTREFRAELEKLFSEVVTLPCDSFRAALTLEIGALIAKTASSGEKEEELLKQSLNETLKSAQACSQRSEYLGCWPIEMGGEK